MALIVESVQRYLDVIVSSEGSRGLLEGICRGLTLGQVRAYAVPVPTDHHDVEVLLVIAEISVGAFGSGLAIRRLVLNES